MQVSGITASGADAANYRFATSPTTTASILASDRQSHRHARVRRHDWRERESLRQQRRNLIDGVNGETLTLSGSGLLATKNAGPQQPFASNGLNSFTLTGNGAALASNYTWPGGLDWAAMTLGGADAGNYVLVQPFGPRISPCRLLRFRRNCRSRRPLHLFRPSPLRCLSRRYRRSSAHRRPRQHAGARRRRWQRDDTHGERNVARSDLHPGLALTVINGGIRLPAN